jgi:hypothetical protein
MRSLNFASPDAPLQALGRARARLGRVRPPLSASRLQLSARTRRRLEPPPRRACLERCDPAVATRCQACLGLVPALPYRAQVSSQPSLKRSPCKMQSQPAFGASPAPAFGATPAPAFGAASTPAFGAAPTSAFGAKPAFGGFGASAASPFGASSTPAFGASAPAFGASSAPGEPSLRPSAMRHSASLPLPAQSSSRFDSASVFPRPCSLWRGSLWGRHHLRRVVAGLWRRQRPCVWRGSQRSSLWLHADRLWEHHVWRRRSARRWRLWRRWLWGWCAGHAGGGAPQDAGAGRQRHHRPEDRCAGQGSAGAGVAGACRWQCGWHSWPPVAAGSAIPSLRTR